MIIKSINNANIHYYITNYEFKVINSVNYDNTILDCFELLYTYLRYK